MDWFWSIKRPAQPVARIGAQSSAVRQQNLEIISKIILGGFDGGIGGGVAPGGFGDGSMGGGGFEDGSQIGGGIGEYPQPGGIGEGVGGGYAAPSGGYAGSGGYPQTGFGN